MAELVEFKYISHNRYGTPIIVDTNTNIVPIGIAHETGVSEEWLLNQYQISRAQLHSALAYFYEHREEIRQYETETERLLQEYGTDGSAKLEELKKRRSQKS